MKLTVTGQSIVASDLVLLVSDTENVYEAEYTFDDEWDGYSKTAVFEGCGSTYSVVLSEDSCMIPNEVLADSGYVRFGVLGTKVVDSTTLRYPTVWTDKIWVDVASAGTTTPPSPTPDVYATIIANEEALDTRLDTAESEIDTLQEASHSHSNKSVLDTITTALVTAWSGAVTWIATNGSNILTHIADTVIHVTSTEKSTWNGKSTVSVSSSGTATDEVEYITIDGAEKKLKGGDAKAFLATYGTTTASEIATAVTAGKAIFVKYDDDGGVAHQLMLVDESNSKYGFAESTVGTSGDITSVAGMTITLNKQDNVWEVFTGSGSIPTKTSDLTNDSGFITEHQSLSAYRTSADQDVIDDTLQPKTDNSLSTTSKTVVGGINEVDSIAKGANQAVSYGNISTMVTALNAMASGTYKTGQNIYIVTTDVPDVWVSSIESTSVPYTYTTDSAFVSALSTDGYVQMGYYKVSALETQKVDLTNYPTKSEAILGVQVAGTDLTPDANRKVNVPLATGSLAGAVKVSGGLGMNNGTIYINSASETEIANKSVSSKALAPNRLDYAIKAGLTSNSQITTDSDKKSICNTIGAVYDGQYELIEEITLTELVSTITRTQTPSGKPYDFKALVIIINASQDTSAHYCPIRLNNVSCSTYQTYTGGTYIVSAFYDCSKGRLNGECVTGTTPDGQYTIRYTPNSKGYFEIASITSVLVATDYLSVGDKIAIYGVWA